MRSRLLVVIMLSAIILTVILILREEGSLHERSATPIASPQDKIAKVELVEAQVDEGRPSSSKLGAGMSQGMGQDGPALLEERCSQCHTARVLEQVKQPRGDWEKSLAKMEGFGVRLDDDQKAILLDYLATK